MVQVSSEQRVAIYMAYTYEAALLILAYAVILAVPELWPIDLLAEESPLPYMVSLIELTGPWQYAVLSSGGLILMIFISSSQKGH